MSSVVRGSHPILACQPPILGCVLRLGIDLRFCVASLGGLVSHQCGCSAKGGLLTVERSRSSVSRRELAVGRPARLTSVDGRDVAGLCGIITSRGGEVAFCRRVLGGTRIRRPTRRLLGGTRLFVHAPCPSYLARRSDEPDGQI